MSVKLTEIDEKNHKYKFFDKTILKYKAIEFENACLENYENDNHAAREYDTRKELISQAKLGIISNFLTIEGRTYEEMERALPKDVYEAWIKFYLYLSNTLPVLPDKYIHEKNTWYIFDFFCD